MYSMNRFGQNRPLCNNRQFITMGIIHHKPEEMDLKPEYLGNEHFKFLNDFGLQQKYVSDKKFLDINNTVNRHSPNHINSSFIMHTFPSSLVNSTANYHTSAKQNNHKGVSEKPFVTDLYEKSPCTANIPEDCNKIDTETNKFEKASRCRKSPPRGCEEAQGCSNIKHPRKSKNSNKSHDKMKQKPSKKSKKQNNYHKQSKRESDRNIIGNSCARKHKGDKPWHKESLEKELMDIDDFARYTDSNHSIESPSITSVCSTISIPSIESFYVETLSPPIKIITESRIPNTTIGSPTIYDLKEQNDINMGNSPKQNGFRPRLPSECESEDSFIVFEENSKSFDMDDDQESADFDSTSDDDDDSEEEDEEDDDDDDDDVDMDICAITIKQSNGRLKSSSPRKKVRFASGKDLCEVHPMIQWSFAYEKARKGPWEQFAVDRMRFRNRVSHVEPVLDVILQPGHRRKVYQDRFLPDDN